MNTYKVLNKQVFSQGEYKLVPIRFEDRWDIMNWRNEQIFHLRQSEPLTEEVQDAYFQNVVTNYLIRNSPIKFFFLF